MPSREMADEHERKQQLLVLVGPEGAGKTTLGRMLEQRLGARFVQVERVVQRVFAEGRGGAAGRITRAVLDELAVQAADNDLLVIEATGAAGESFFGVLRESYEALFVHVHAEQATCNARLRAREQAGRAAPSDELRARMYERSSQLAIPWDLELDNDGGLDARSVADAVRPLLRA